MGIPYLKMSKTVSGKSALLKAVVMGSSNKEEGEGQCLLTAVTLTWAGKKGNSQAAKAEPKGRCKSWQALDKGEDARKLTQLQWQWGLRNL